MPFKRTYFKSEWTDPKINPNWCNIIEAVRNDTFSFFCKICGKKCSLSNMGRQAIVSHINSGVHKKNCNIVKENCKIVDILPSHSLMIHGNDKTIEKNEERSIVNLFNRDPNISKAEIMWTMHIIENNGSMNSCNKTIPIFKLMFTDSEIAKKMQLSATKSSYLYTFGLCEYFTELFKENFKNIKYYVVCFDESLNKIAQKCQMDFYIRIFNNITNKVDTRYLRSVFIEGRPNAENVLHHFLKGIEGNRILI